MKCPECGATGDGNFCVQCGARLAPGGGQCDECGAAVEAGDRYCSGCGAPVGERVRKPVGAYLPWILTGLALVIFAVAITLFIQGQAEPRQEGMPPTGSVIQGSDGGDGTGVGDGPAAGAEGAMPSADALAAMSPRQAADRLFDRAMRERETGREDQARFFADMARKAYTRVPRSEFDADARFHVGLLALVEGDTTEARAQAESILSDRPGHLLGLLLAGRAAESVDARRRFRSRFANAADTTDLSSEAAYAAHRRLIESTRDSLER